MSGIAGVIYRDWRQRITNVGFVFWDLLVPAAYLVLFGTGFDYALARSFVVDGREIEYTSYLLPGVIAMTAFSVAMNTAWGFFMDKDSGIFYEILTYPMTRRQFLIGKVCFNVTVSLIGALLTILLGVWVMDVPVRWDLAPLTALVIVATTAGWFFLLSIFAIRLPQPRRILANVVKARGRFIREAVLEQGYRASQLADFLACHPSNVSRAKG
jgi:ABC-2 type transport system permease protein